MAKEIERKFLVKKDIDWKKSVSYSYEIVQGYLSSDKNSITRIRIKNNKDAFITIKSKSTGITRDEFEYEIPVNDGFKLLKLCKKPILSKIRHNISYGGKLWEVDVFKGNNKGLIIAEIELKSEKEKIDLPPWIGKEVSKFNKYNNASLARKPFSKW